MTDRIGAVNGLRGIAILMVVLHHLFIPFTASHALHPSQISSDGWFAAFINDAWLGVNIFFVLLIERFKIGKVVLTTLLASGSFIYIGQRIPIDRVGSFKPFTTGIFGSCYEFLLGMLICKLYTSRIRLTLHSVVWIRWLLPVSVCAAGLYLMHHDLPIGELLPGNMLFVLGFAGLLLAILCGENLPRWLLEGRALQLVGCMCYSIYAWHGLIMNSMIPPMDSTRRDTLRMMAPFCLVTAALSCLSYRYIDFRQEENWRKLFLLDRPPLDTEARARTQSVRT